MGDGIIDLINKKVLIHGIFCGEKMMFRYLYDSDVTQGAMFSGNFIIKAFVQLPDRECIYSAKKAFQLLDFLIPSIDTN